jgi:hypothetical protein
LTPLGGADTDFRFTPLFMTAAPPRRSSIPWRRCRHQGKSGKSAGQRPGQAVSRANRTGPGCRGQPGPEGAGGLRNAHRCPVVIRSFHLRQAQSAQCGICVDGAAAVRCSSTRGHVRAISPGARLT